MKRNLSSGMYLFFLLAGFLITGCATVSTDKNALSKSDISLKNLCEASRINWSWDSVAQVITLQINGRQAKGLVGSDVVLLDQELVFWPKPLQPFQPPNPIPFNYSLF